MKKRLIWVTLAVGLLLALATIIVRLLEQEPVPTPSYWPTQEWLDITPEEQGIDSAKLAQGLRSISAEDIDIHSLLIIRNGLVVVDAAFYPYDGQTVHEVASVTKSVMTTLIGIAVDQGKLQLDQSMVSFFHDRSIANLDERKKRITVRHLVSMTSGLDSLGLKQDEGTLKHMQASEDWIQYALNRPVVHEPGTKFVYDSPGMHLLSAILQQATGQTALEFAWQNLFVPLGINQAIWKADPQGYNDGWAELYLHPRDMAKIGYLWLNQGVWDDRQIVSREWVENSVNVQTKTGMNDDYGYGWWIMSDKGAGEYAAIGRGGQRIHLLPELNLLVVTTGGGFNIDEIWPYLEPTLVDPSNPLPANPAGVKQLKAALAAVVKAPDPMPVAVLPALAKAISGKTYLLEPNPLQLKTLRLDFNDSAEAALKVTFTNNRPSPAQPVGLDGVYRLIPDNNQLPQGARGYWSDARTFVLEYDEIAANNHINFRLQFTDDRIALEGLETDHEQGVLLKGRQQP